MNVSAERIARLKNRIKEAVLVIDGAMGTAIQDQNLTEADFGGEAFDGCNEYLVLQKPDLIKKIHEDYLQAGADIIETNTFGGTELVLDEFFLGKKAFQINQRAAELARQAADKFSTPEKPRFVAGSIGPTTKAISVTGGITFEELIKNFKQQAEALYAGGADYYLIETCQDSRNIKAALLAIDEFQNEKDIKLPVAISGTIETMGTMLAGQTIEALITSFMHRDLLYLGLNCATGPEFMTDHIRSLAENSPFAVACVPNAGLPDEDGNYLENPQMMVRVLKNFGDNKWLNLIGGCCGTTPAHIQAFSELSKSLEPRELPKIEKSLLSGIDYLEVTEDVRPVLVGERTNVIGSRKFKRLITEGKWEEAAEVGRQQVKNQAQIVDICLANPDRDELEDMTEFLEYAVKKLTVPLMIDSTDAKVIERALTYCQGKAIINSINLEDGEERFEEVCPMAKKYGAALVVGCIDDDPHQGMGVSVERKLEIAKRSYDLLTNKYGITAEDIYWDPLVFPCGTGDENYVGSAAKTVEGVRVLKENFPGTKTILGISNVSFGLPEAGREVLNSVFLYHCVQAGLDLAIVNSQKVERYAQIPAEEIKLCDDLIWFRGKDPVAAFNAHFGVKKKKKANKSDIPLDQRLSDYIIEGTKEGLIEDLELKRKEATPLEIVNGPLMAGMDEVGRLFNENKLIVAEVLQSAESMKTAVRHLEQFMEKSEESCRGRVVLATVKGDVHDIGKNLVEIILSNNGFDVINLGIKVPPQDLIAAAREHKPHIIGLSGLLVKSAQQMVTTAQDLSSAGIETPILVGGAALSRNFVDRKIAPAYTQGTVEYAKDAMDGLELAKQIVDTERFETLKSKILSRRTELQKTAPKEKKVIEVKEERSPILPPQPEPPQPPDFERHIVEVPLDRVWAYINPLMLMGRHLGVKGNYIRALSDAKLRREVENDEGFQKALQIRDTLDEVKVECRSFLKAKGVYRFFKANSTGNELRVYNGSKTIQWKFKRQPKEQGLCLSDLVNPTETELTDNIGIFVTTCEGPAKEKAEEWKNQGNYLKSHVLFSLALETAEAMAEYLHGLLRSQWGFPDQPTMVMMERFQAKYRGKRYSFGYPACPELEYQEQLFQLLQPEDIGVQLTDGYMMEPECSVSALAFSHPNATYFAV